MEALTAIGLAANVVQFVQFATKIVSHTMRVYRTKEASEGDLTIGKLTSSLEAHSKALCSSLEYQESDGFSLSVADKEILEMCRQCEELTRKLLATLGGLRSSKTTMWGSFIGVLKTSWSEEEIEKLCQTLDRYRQQIALLMMASVRDEVRALQTRQNRNDERLISTVEETRAKVESFFEHFAQLRLWQDEVTKAIHDDYECRKSDSDKGLVPATDMQRDMTVDDSRRFHKGLLYWLRFTELDYRYEKIEKAHEETFKWIFRNPRDGQWSCFRQWLKSDADPLYWITGKPAAGKSTLMKYIHSNPQTKQYLHEWAQGRTLIMTSFYFWGSGTPIQMSEEGMARTLLSESLRQAPELAVLLFPHKVEEYLMFRNTWKDPITLTELKKALRLLAQQAGTEYNVFFLIDGLDECQGDHGKLITMIQELSSPGVKICASSRPWIIFEDGFQQHPNLRLENLTYHDIERFVSLKFQKNRGFAQLRALDPRHTNELVTRIITKASGVFLWVSLVTNSLLEGLSDGERLEQLHERLEALPADLESLFWSILTHLQGKHLARASELIQIIRAAFSPVNLLTLSYADETDPDYAIKFPLGKISMDQAHARAEFFRRGLNACCKGLIESKPQEHCELAYTKVGYLHRTVKDYLEREEIWSKLTAATDEKFNPYLRLCTASIVKFKIRDQKVFQDGGVGKFWLRVSHVIKYATKADPRCTKQQQPKLLNELDRTLVYLASLKEDWEDRNWLETLESNYMTPVKHWSVSYLAGNFAGSFCASIGAPDLNRTSFLHLAIQFQLTDYVRYMLRRKGRSICDKETFSRALIIAFTECEIFDVESGDAMNRDFRVHKGRDPGLIELLLSYGADPNAKLQNVMMHSSESVGSYTPWVIFLNSWTGEGFERVGKSLLDSGADPFLVKPEIPELFDYARKCMEIHGKKKKRFRLSMVGDLGRKKHENNKTGWWSKWRK
ncbi:hypothetical protein DM02DRAFT_702654 [Periconia macrospinosa]|uniref:Uncharacterized protein n=1 Tax=Periconia macrospinosa TaxID=97972 RepID=A0A2V1DVD4_9PLEO|nr:hypothetical protein DM02DRAFT_702654 [Periconia macrospinosa]